MAGPSFAHLNVYSGFSFLEGASPVEALVLAAADRGQAALALTDRDSVSGVVSLSARCAKAGVKPVGGCDLTFEGGFGLTLLMDGPRGWSSLCRVLSAAHLRDPERIGPRARWEDLAASAAAGLVCLSGSPERGEVPRLLRRGRYDEAEAVARRCLETFGRDSYAVEVTRTLTPGEDRLSERLFALADHLGAPAVATNAVRHARKADVAAQEALCRVRLGLAPGEQHAALPFNGERYVKGAAAMADLFRDRPDALENAALLAERLDAPLAPGRRHLPAYPKLPAGESAFSHLAALTWRGAREQRYPGEKFTPQVRARLVHELETIRELEFCDYFLVCADVCREARARGVGYGLRGSAVGSAVAYCLRMGDHDPLRYGVSFERFLSKARAKPPDVDVDFRHDERDAMMTYVRDTYGHDRVANVANYVTYRGRSLLRDLGKALGFDGPEVDRLRELLWHSRGDDLAEKLEAQPELRALGIEPGRYADLFALCGALAGLPRHLGTHSSGIVVSDVPLCAVAPVRWAAKGVTVVALDKDDAEAEGVGLLKMDQLSLRALTAVEIAAARLRRQDPGFDYAGRDREDPEALALIRAARTVGVFQLESPAQMALQWRLKADRFDDLIASVALIRPGPLVGGGVWPYVAARHGWREVTYPLPELEPVLKETYGRILYQDQVLDVVRVVGGFTANEADAWLKAMTRARSEEEITDLGVALMERARPKGLSGRRFAKLWRQIKGFARYGFCHGHSLAFADHAQGTAWLAARHPAEFFAAVLSVEPCGFWPVATVAEEAKRRGVRVLGPCANRSAGARWEVEEGRPDGAKAIRCPLGFVRGVRPAVGEAVVREREAGGPFASLPEFARRCGALLPDREAWEWLALSGALDGLGGGGGGGPEGRRALLWSLPSLLSASSAVRGGVGGPQHGLPGLEEVAPPPVPGGLPPLSLRERLAWEWKAVGFSPVAHPAALWRAGLDKAGVLPCAELQQREEGERVAVAGLPLRPHRPPTPSGEVVVFLTLEDETGLAQVTAGPEAYARCGAALFAEAGMVVVEGVAKECGAGVILVAEDARSLPG